MTINERVGTIITELYNGTKRAFSMFIGVSPTVIENVVGTRQGKPSYDVLEKICAKANVSGDWLLTGEGSMLKPSTPSEPPCNAAVTAVQGEAISTLKDIIKEQAKEIARLEIALEAAQKPSNPA